MLHESRRGKLFTRRAAILAGAKLGLFGVLGARLYYLQVMEADRYAVLSERNRVSVRLISPPRGPIVDRYGVALAENRQNYRLIVVPDRAGDVERTLTTLTALIGLTERETRKALRDVARASRFTPITVRDNLSWEEVATIEVNATDLPGAAIDAGRTRFYAHGEKTVHLVGYVSSVSRDEISNDPFLKLPDARIGKSGVERAYDTALRGEGGAMRVEVNALGRIIRELERDQGKVGRKAVLAADFVLQDLAYRRLGDQFGSVTVMDAVNGDVLCLVSRPGFDPNQFNQGIDGDAWRRLTRDPHGPMTNKALAGLYAPGSVFKMIVALAALENSVIEPDFTVFCTGHIDFGNTRFHCWEKNGHGRVDLETGIRRSCDIYFYELARRTGIDRIADMARRFGYGRETGIDLVGERRGLVPSREWKRGALGSSWQQGETLILGIGQGYILATPIQLAVATALMVNGGNPVVPRVMGPDTASEIMSITARQPSFPGVSAEARTLIKQAMDNVVNVAGGTAYGSRILQPAFAMGGKTGTSQVRRISRSERLTGVLKNHQLPREQRDHAIFVGYAPVSAPRYVCAVVVEHGGSGGSVAAPIARDILLETQNRATMATNGALPASGLG